MHNKTLKFLTLIITSIAIIGCAPQGVKVPISEPAKYPDATKLRKITVAPFGGREGGQVAALLQNSLAKVKVDGRPFFQVVGGSERSAYKAISAKLSGVATQKAIRYGKSLGVEGVYAGEVRNFKASDKRYTERRSKCVRRSEKKKGWLGIAKCEQTRTYTVNCLQTSATVSVDVNLIEIASRSTVLGENYSASRSDKKCTDRGTPRSSSALLATALDDVANQIVRDVAPHTRSFLFVYKQAMKGSARCPSFDSGVKFIQSGDLERGCARWYACESENIDDPYLNYNLALCDGMEGDVEAALERVQDSIDQLGEPDKDMAAAETTYKNVLENAGLLSDQIIGRSGRTAHNRQSRSLGSDPHVLRAQQLLNKLGFDAGPADGLMGERTRTAVISFQHSQGVPATGQVDRSLLRSLKANSAAR